MAREFFKKWITSFMNPAIERSTYVLMSNLVLFLLFWKWQPMSTVVWEVKNETIYWIVIGIFALGWIVVLASTFMINHFELTGLQQIYNNWKDKPSKSASFQVKYLYKFVRHPLMLGFLMVFWTTPYMTLGHLLFTGVMTFYIFTSVKYLEEKDLQKTIGKDYEVYQKEVPMIVPFSKRSK